MEKIVFTRTLEDVSWNNTTIRREFNPEEIKALKLMPGKDLLIGPGRIIQTFMAYNLVDEYRFWIHPVLLGKGTPIFSELQHREDLKLIKQNPFKSGIIELIYQPVK
jgi:dihydrofolate reductase